MNGELDNLIQYVAKNVPFIEEKYPELKGTSDEQRFIFGLRHSALHFAKSAGKIADSLEKVDHGKELQKEELRENTIKSLVNTLLLAKLLDLTEADIVKALEEKYKERI
jgi:hypothetical protein